MSGTLQWRKWKKDKKHQINFSLTFLNLFLAWMLYFHVWLLNLGKIQSLEWILYSQFGIYQTILSTLWQPRQNNLSDPEIYSEPCQISMIECFVKTIIFLVEHSILDVCKNSQYAFVIFYSLFGKIEGANKMDLVAM